MEIKKIRMNSYIDDNFAHLDFSVRESIKQQFLQNLQGFKSKTVEEQIADIGTRMQSELKQQASQIKTTEFEEELKAKEFAKAEKLRIEEEAAAARRTRAQRLA